MQRVDQRTGSRQGVEVADDLGGRVRLPDEARRIVSLVPSLTESLASTARDRLVAATRWCTEPPDLDVLRVAGTKNPDVGAIVRLRPDLVLANEEENRPADLAELRAAGLSVRVTRVRSVSEALSSLDRMLVLACGLPRPDWLTRAQRMWAAPAAPLQRRAIVPIWRRPWMALGRDTFAGDLLAWLGVHNVLAGAAERYPRIQLDQLPPHDWVVLPDEPYRFTATDGPEAFPGRTVRLVSGRHLTWYGPSLVAARAVSTQQLRPDEPTDEAALLASDPPASDSVGYS